MNSISKYYIVMIFKTLALWKKSSMGESSVFTSNHSVTDLIIIILINASKT